MSSARRIAASVVFSLALFALPSSNVLADDCGGISCRCVDCDSSGSSSSGGGSGGGGGGGGWQSTEDLKNERPTFIQGVFMWPMILMMDVVMVPVGLLGGAFDGGKFDILSRTTSMTVNYCPLVIGTRAASNGPPPVELPRTR